MIMILLVGEPTLHLKFLRRGLLSFGFEARPAKSNRQIWSALAEEEIAAVVLDASVSNGASSPWHFFNQFRSLDLPLIVLIRPDRDQDRERALDQGVDACLPVPLSARELSTCLESLLTRRHAQRQPDISEMVSDYVDTDLQIDLKNRQIRRAGKSFPLTSREYPLLQRLMRDPGSVISSKELCQMAWGFASWPQKRKVLKVYILNLRRKIEVRPNHPKYIVSRRGFGYAFMPQVRADRRPEEEVGAVG